MSKIAMFELEPWEMDYIKEHLPSHEIQFFEERLNESHLEKIKDIEILGLFINSPVTRDTIEKLPNLKLVTTMSTGFDHIDIEACKEKGITASTVPFYGENTVAEHAMALLLAISRKIPQTYDQVLHNDFSLTELRGFDLKGKTLGVIGTGHIGQHVIRMAKGFEMDVIAYDPFPKEGLAENLGFTYRGFDDVLRDSDAISLHAPYNEYTHHMINSGNMHLLKKGMVLINTARGGLIETNALLKALNDETIAFAGLDVLEGEACIKEEKELIKKDWQSKVCDMKIALADQIIINHPHVLYTIHNAFNSEEALKRILDTTIENIQKFGSGDSQNVVSK